MAKASKWLEDIQPEQRVTSVARKALALRLAGLSGRLRRAARAPHSEIEPVHQLRVATRRAIAAIDAFHTLLPSRKTARLRKMLGRIRRGAGAARDLDVLLIHLRSLSQSQSHPAWEMLLEHVALLRQQAQEPIEQLDHDVRRPLKRRTTQVCHRVRWRDTKANEPSFVVHATQQVRLATDRFFTAGQAIQGSGAFADTQSTDLQPLHQFRIAGKRLRYAMELFAAAFADDFRGELYPLLCQIQEELGHVNDHATAAERYAHWLPHCHDVELADLVQTLLGARRTALESARAKFLVWWTPERVAHLRRRFDEVLAQPVIHRFAS